jgi:hypothetical protein
MYSVKTVKPFTEHDINDLIQTQGLEPNYDTMLS